MATKFFFRQKNLAEIVESIESKLDSSTREFISLTPTNESLKISIDRMGHSELEFLVQPEAGNEGLLCTLGKEKLSFGHKALRSQFMQKIVDLVVLAGGEIR